MDADIIATPTMVIKVAGVEVMTVAAGVEAMTVAATGEAMTVAATGEATPDHVVMGKITTYIVTVHSVHESPIPAISNHGQSGIPVIPGGLTTSTQNGLATPTQTPGACGATRAKARANVTGPAW